jgi:GNAT superfamily N-acetyltransferase
MTEHAYWGRWRTRQVLDQQIDGAWRVVGAYVRGSGQAGSLDASRPRPAPSAGEMVGFARAVSDGVVVAYLADVFVAHEHRGAGVGVGLVRKMIDDGPGAHFRWMLHTADAHSLYRKFGFADPDATYLERPAAGTTQPDSTANTTPDTDRVEPPRLGEERAMLEAWLDYYRATLMQKCAGLTADQLVVRSCPPSPMSLAGLVRHMTEMERMYAHRLEQAGVSLRYCTDESPDGDFDDAVADVAFDDLMVFADHCARSRRIMSAIPLDHVFPGNDSYSLRWIYLYLIKEYARHLGHADLLRERVDGVTGE